MIKLFRFYKPYKWLVFIALVVLFMQAIAELYLPTLMSDVVNNGMMKGDTGYIWKYGFFMLLVTIASGVCAIVGSYLSSMIGVGYGRDIRNSLFKKIESYSLHEFDKIGTASLITRTTNDVTQVQMVIIMGMRFLVYSPILCIGGIIMALLMDGPLTIVLGVVVPLLILVIGGLASLIVPLYKEMQKKLDRLNLVMRENLIGIRVIRAFNRLDSEKARFSDANQDLTDTAIKVNKIMAAMQPIMLLFMNITSVSIIWFAGIRIGNGQMELGDMMAFLQYAMQIMFSLIMVSMMYVMVPRAQASAARINEVFEMDPEITDPEEPHIASIEKGYIEFRDVSFSYPGAEEPAIYDISFCAKPGEVTAIIGGTGSGKSTLISLIPRYYDVEKGSVLVDGIDIREMNQSDLRSKIGFVPQSAILFSGSINENIRFGKEDASEEEVKYAAQVAQANEFITEMEQGFDSIIAQGGTNISGGQKQRLSIARALVRRPEIYIFDDSFSALDFKTDAKLRAALKNEIKDSTVIIVAQRVSTVMDADRILVLDEGHIVGIGNHRELMKTCDVYREIVASQLSEEESA